MYWTTCSSLSPAIRRSRTRIRRSCARSALDSSIDSFWQTTQRRPRLISRARASSAGSASISFGSTAAAGSNAVSTIGASNSHPNDESPNGTAGRAASPMPSWARRRLAAADGSRRPPGHADAIPAIGQGDQAADHHEDRADPQPGRQRVVIDAHRMTAVALVVAEHDVEVAEARRANGGLGRLLMLHGIEALLRIQAREFLAVAADDELRRGRPCSWGLLAVTDALEQHAVAADLGRSPGRMTWMLFGPPGRGGHDAGDDDAEAGMRQRHP